MTTNVDMVSYPYFELIDGKFVSGPLVLVDVPFTEWKTINLIHVNSTSTIDAMLNFISILKGEEASGLYPNMTIAFDDVESLMHQERGLSKLKMIMPKDEPRYSKVPQVSFVCKAKRSLPVELLTMDKNMDGGALDTTSFLKPVAVSVLAYHLRTLFGVEGSRTVQPRSYVEAYMKNAQSWTSYQHLVSAGILLVVGEYVSVQPDSSRFRRHLTFILFDTWEDVYIHPSWIITLSGYLRLIGILRCRPGTLEGDLSVRVYDWYLANLLYHHVNKEMYTLAYYIDPLKIPTQQPQDLRFTWKADVSVTSVDKADDLMSWKNNARHRKMQWYRIRDRGDGISYLDHRMTLCLAKNVHSYEKVLYPGIITLGGVTITLCGNAVREDLHLLATQYRGGGGEFVVSLTKPYKSLVTIASVFIDGLGEDCAIVSLYRNFSLQSRFEVKQYRPHQLTSGQGFNLNSPFLEVEFPPTDQTRSVIITISTYVTAGVPYIGYAPYFHKK